MVFFQGMTEGMYFLVGLLAYVFILGGLVIVLTHKFFGLVVWLPENIFKWLGHHGTAMGEHNDEQKSQSLIVGGLSTAQRAGSNAAQLNATKANNPNNKGGGVENAGGYGESTGQATAKVPEGPTRRKD